MPTTLGLHGEYLLPLWEPHEDMDFSNLDFQFDLIVAADGEIDPNPCSIQQFEQEEQALVTSETASNDSSEKPGDRPLPPKQLQTFDTILKEIYNDLHSYVTKELAATLGLLVLLKPWAPELRPSDFDLQTHRHREAFLSRLQAEVPDELLLAPTCGPSGSLMQRFAARTPEQKSSLQDYREWHHEIYLNFVKKAFLIQVRNGAHAHLEHSTHALAWRTRALRNLPGFFTLLD